LRNEHSIIGFVWRQVTVLCVALWLWWDQLISAWWLYYDGEQTLIELL
jgi:hypothetical protein